MQLGTEYREQLRPQGKQSSIFERFRQTPAMRARLWRQIGLIWLITWIPIAGITLFNDAFWDGTIHSFLGDPEMQIRILIAIPILLRARHVILANVTAVLEYATHNLVNDEERVSIWQPAVERAKAMMASRWSSLAMLILIALGIVRLVMQAADVVDGNDSMWFAYSVQGVDHFTLAGWWAFLVVTPIFQYALYRVLWIYGVWIWLLWKLASTELTLSAIHPDGMGGLGILFMAASTFLYPFTSLTAVLAGSLAFDIWAGTLGFEAARYEMAVAVLLGLALVFGPLLLFMQDLLTTQCSGLVEYGIVGTALSRAFRKQWVEGSPADNASDAVDPSMVADYSQTYMIASRLNPFPFTGRQVVVSMAVLASPFVLVIYTQVSFAQVIDRLIGLIS